MSDTGRRIFVSRRYGKTNWAVDYITEFLRQNPDQRVCVMGASANLRALLPIELQSKVLCQEHSPRSCPRCAEPLAQHGYCPACEFFELDIGSSAHPIALVATQLIEDPTSNIPHYEDKKEQDQFLTEIFTRLGAIGAKAQREGERELGWAIGAARDRIRAEAKLLLK